MYDKEFFSPAIFHIIHMKNKTSLLFYSCINSYGVKMQGPSTTICRNVFNPSCSLFPYRRVADSFDVEPGGGSHAEADRCDRG